MRLSLARPLGWRRLLNLGGLVFAVVALGFLNFLYVAQEVVHIMSGAEPADWWVYGEAVERIDGGMYEWDGLYRHRYPPLFAYRGVLLAHALARNSTEVAPKSAAGIDGRSGRAAATLSVRTGYRTGR